jgi:hypothetical protein
MVLAHQLFKRLETEGECIWPVILSIPSDHLRFPEGFVEAEIMHTDDLGLLETRTKTSRRKSKTKGKQMKQRKQIQKTRYVFNHALKTSPEYLEYFNPSREVESRILGFSQLVSILFSSYFRCCFIP